METGIQPGLEGLGPLFIKRNSTILFNPYLKVYVYLPQSLSGHWFVRYYECKVGADGLIYFKPV